MKVAKNKKFTKVMEADYRDQLPPIRISSKGKDMLEKEAEYYGHTLSGYLRWLISLGRDNLELPKIKD